MPAVQLVPFASRPDRGRAPQAKRSVRTQDLVADIATAAWGRMLGMIADGVPPHQAIIAVGATRPMIEGMLRSDSSRVKQWNDARVAAERRHWDMDLIGEICNEIAAGLTVKSACRKRGKQEAGFVKLVLLDPAIREEYDLARKIRAELWADESIEIADEDCQDLDLQGRGNMAAVKRSDIRISTRRRLMEDFNKDRFSASGKKSEVNVQVNVNAAERLEAARHRRNLLRVESVPETIEGEIVQPPDEDWLK